MQSSYREVLRCLLEGIQWLVKPSGGISVAGNSGISQARTRLGWEPLRQLHGEVQADSGSGHEGRVVSRVATGEHRRQHAGHRRREGQRRGFRPPGSQSRRARVSADPLRVAGGKRDPCPFRQPDGDYATSEIALAKTVLPSLGKGMLQPLTKCVSMPISVTGIGGSAFGLTSMQQQRRAQER
jgi:hypothetical protein